jgi:hypothetical protein
VSKVTSLLHLCIFSHLDNVKTQAIDQLLANDCPFQDVGTLLPDAVDARQFVQYPDDWDAQPFNTVMFEGNTHQYLLNAPDSCVFSYSLVAEKPVFGTSRFEILVDDIAVDTLVIPGPTTAGVDTFHIGNLTLNRGLHTMQLRYLTWCYGTHALLFNPNNDCTTRTVDSEKKTIQVYPNPTSSGVYINGVRDISGG